MQKKNKKNLEKKWDESIAGVTDQSIEEVIMEIKNKSYLKTMIGKRVGSLIVCITCVMLLACSPAFAGEPVNVQELPAERPIEVYLNGATEYGSVQLFAYLLTKLEAVNRVVPIMLHVETDYPQRCRARWSVWTTSEDTTPLVEQIAKIISELDPNGQNNVLYESPFIVTERVLGQVKTAKPVIIVPDRLVFAIDSNRDRMQKMTDVQITPSINPWFALPGAGFD